ncbi:protein serine/threonine phosphatase 2C [Stipitochalara longipes BDJ]|nr:protein serine/threonine phosphatase 2C [Stipitochalara longipes BDJ]
MKDVEAWLVKEQGIHHGTSGSGVQQWHSSRHASNSPCEDELVSAKKHLPQSSSEGTQPWMFWGVFDGHVGGTTSAVLRESLISYVARSLSQLFQSPPVVEIQKFRKSEEADMVVDTIKSAFKQLDDEFIQGGMEALGTAKTTTEALSQLAPGLSGACAILSIYDPNRNVLRVANVGDCRGVLGTIDPTTNKYITTPLSIDQNGFNKSEVARVRAEHPGEADVVNEKDGRTLGMAPSRVFGDGIWKWPREVGMELYEHFWSFKPRSEKVYLTPPYLTAEPVITTTKIERKGEFMILATDGLWDCISNEQAVKLVEMWLQAKKAGNIKGKPKSETTKMGLAKRIPKDRRVKEEDFVVLDENCATHLVRNALGGGNEEVLCAIVGAAPAWSRDARDDITVQVIFFDDK